MVGLHIDEVGTDQHLRRFSVNRSASLSFFCKRKRCGFEAMDLLCPPESANTRALAATG
jgi:hypothetical protein